jgi:hypothetical protein
MTITHVLWMMIKYQINVLLYALIDRIYDTCLIMFSETLHFLSPENRMEGQQ